MKNEWQDLKTLNKSERVLFITNLNNIYVGQWSENMYSGNEAFIISEDGKDNQFVVELSKCTHWMPLPKPPTKLTIC